MEAIPDPHGRSAKGCEKFFDDSELAHFWLSFTRIPADPHLSRSANDCSSVSGAVLLELASSPTRVTSVWPQRRQCARMKQSVRYQTGSNGLGLL